MLKLLEMANEDFASSEDVAAIFRALIQAIKDHRDAVSGILAGSKVAADAEAKKLTTTIAENARQAVQGSAAAREKAIKHADDIKRSLTASIESLQEAIEDLEDELPNAAAVQQAVRELQASFKAAQAEPFTAENVRNKLESLEGPSKLKIDAIFELREELDKMRKSIEVRSSSPGTIITQQRGAVRYYDLSPELNGVKFTFALPAFARILTVQSTSAPVIFRPGIDYTEDGNAMTITFTSQVDPATTLSAGQTLLITYAEN